MNSHKIISPFRYVIVKHKTKQIDNIYIMFLPIGLNGLVKNSYMGIRIHPYSVDGI
jgi:hypothetical protein